MLRMPVSTFAGIVGACAWAVAPYIYHSPPTAGLGVRSCHTFGCKALSSVWHICFIRCEHFGVLLWHMGGRAPWLFSC